MDGADPWFWFAADGESSVVVSLELLAPSAENPGYSAAFLALLLRCDVQNQVGCVPAPDCFERC